MSKIGEKIEKINLESQISHCDRDGPRTDPGNFSLAQSMFLKHCLANFRKSSEDGVSF